MKKYLSIATRLNKLISMFAFIGRWSVLLMLGIGVWNVIGRYLGVAIGYNLSSNRLIESQWYLFDVIFLSGIGWTLQCENHVRVDILQGNWEEKRKAKIDLLGALILLLPFAIGITLISIEPAIHSLLINESSPDPNGLPRYLMKALIPIGFLLLSLQGISEVIQNIAILKKQHLINDDKKNISSKEKYFD